MALSKVVPGILIGGFLGGTGAAVLYAMESRKVSADNLGIEASFLQSDYQLSELISRYRCLATDKNLEHLYKKVVTSADGLLKCYVEASESKTKGALEFKANRLSYATVQAANQLCKQSFARGNENAPELVRELQNLEGFLNNHLHNMMLV